MDYRLSATTTAHYSSFEDMAKAWGIKPVNRKTKDMKKLADQQEKFAARHKCPACGQMMELVKNTNIFTCKNEKCKGIKHEYTDATGEKKTYYEVAKDLLDEKSSNIANIIF